MNYINIMAVIAAMALGAISSVTDIRYHKVRNKHIVPFLLIGTILQISAVLKDPDGIFTTVLNIFLPFGVAVAFYMIRVWAAGDAKLFGTMVLLLPWQYLSKTIGIEFPAMLTLGFTFSVALIYVIIESAVLYAKSSRSCSDKFSAHPQVKLNREMLLSWITAWLIVDTASGVLKSNGGIIANSPVLIAVFNLLIANAALSLIKGNCGKAVASIAALGIRVILAVLGITTPFRPSILPLAFVAVVMLLRRFTSCYDYRKIPATEIEEGQVLAQSTIAMFLSLGVKNVPLYTDESARCRISPAEASAIKEWGATQGGDFFVVVVRQIPFAPFILAGTLLTVIFSFYMRF